MKWIVAGGLLLMAFISFFLLAADDRVRKDALEMQGCIASSDKECLLKLYKKDQNLNARIGKEWTPLTLASKGGQIEVVAWLIEHGADVNGASTGATAIFWAAHSGNAEVVRYLLSKGADACITAGPQYESPRAIAERRGFIQLANLLPNCT